METKKNRKESKRFENITKLRKHSSNRSLIHFSCCNFVSESMIMSRQNITESFQYLPMCFRAFKQGVSVKQVNELCDQNVESKHKKMAEEKKTTEAKESRETKDASVPEWLMPILTGLGSLGGTYALWVRPLQEGLKKMSEEIQNLKEEVAELKHQSKKRRMINGGRR